MYINPLATGHVYIRFELHLKYGCDIFLFLIRPYQCSLVLPYCFITETSNSIVMHYIYLLSSAFSGYRFVVPYFVIIVQVDFVPLFLYFFSCRMMFYVIVMACSYGAAVPIINRNRTWNRDRGAGSGQ